MTYQLLTHKADSFRLDVSPAGYWLLIQFEIVLRLGNQPALLLTHPSYVKEGGAEPSTGILCPPFFAYALSSDELYLDTAGDVRTFFREQEAGIDIQRAAKMFLYVMGLSNYRLRNKGEMLEFKESNREKGKLKCYKLIRFAVESTHPRDLVNLADPLEQSGFRFLPLPPEEPLRFVRRDSRPTHGITLSYKGISLSSNLCRLLEDENEVARLSEGALSISSTALYCTFKGFLIKFDLANSALLSQHLLRDTAVYYLDNKIVEFSHALILQNLFLTFLARCGIPHHSLLGDGFVAGMPCTQQAVEDGLSRVKLLVEGMDEYVRLVNRTPNSPQLGFRCAILWTDYSYGRFSFLSDGSIFIGRSLTSVTRMEESLKEHVHVRLVTDQTTFREFGAVFRQYFDIVDEQLDLQSKEFHIEAVGMELKNGA